MSLPLRPVVLIRTHPGRGAEQVAAFAASAPAPTVRAEAGCLRYDLHALRDQPDRFVLIEEWASTQALEAHGASEHMRKADAANKAFRAAPAEVLLLAATPVA
ncbi:putative quinol monooxygenase [Micromonosporaceae bacterium Da 78-11]